MIPGNWKKYLEIGLVALWFTLNLDTILDGTELNCDVLLVNNKIYYYYRLDENYYA